MSEFTTQVQEALVAIDQAIVEYKPVARRRDQAEYDRVVAREEAVGLASEIVSIVALRQAGKQAEAEALFADLFGPPALSMVEPSDDEVSSMAREVSLDGRLDDREPLRQLLEGFGPAPVRDDDWATHDSFERLSKYAWFREAGRVNLDDDLSIVPVNGFLDVWDDDARCWVASDVEVTALIARHLRFVGVRLDPDAGITWGDIVGDNEGLLPGDGDQDLDEVAAGWVEWALLPNSVRARWGRWCRATKSGSGNPVRKYDVFGIRKIGDLDGLEQAMADLRKAIERAGGHERKPEQSAGRDRVSAAMSWLT